MIEELLSVLPVELGKLVMEMAPLATFLVLIMNVIKEWLPKDWSEDSIKKFKEALTYVVSILIVVGLKGWSLYACGAGVIVAIMATGGYRLVKKLNGK